MDKQEEVHDIIETLTNDKPEIRLEREKETFRQRAAYREERAEDSKTPVKEIEDVVISQESFRKAEDKLKGKITNPPVEGIWSPTEHEEEFARHLYKQGIHYLQAKDLRETDEEFTGEEKKALRTLHTGQAESFFRKYTGSGLKDDAEIYSEIMGREEETEMKAARMKIVGREHHMDVINTDGEIKTFAARYKDRDYDTQLDQMVEKHHQEGGFTEYLQDFRDDKIDQEKLVEHLERVEKQAEAGLDRVSKNHYPDLRPRSGGLTSFFNQIYFPKA
jgi:hypothetical protein